MKEDIRMIWISSLPALLVKSKLLDFSAIPVFWSSAQGIKRKSYVAYCKPSAVSEEQRERARQMIIKRNKVIVIFEIRYFA